MPDKTTVALLVLGIAGAIAFFTLYGDHSPQASFDLKVDRTEVIARATEYLDQLDYDVEGLTADAFFSFDSGIALYLEATQGLVEAHDILRADTLSTHNWSVDFYDRSLPPSQMRDTYRVWITPAGKILGYRHNLADSVAVESLPEEGARLLADNFLADLGLDLDDFELENSSATQRTGRKDYYFRWARRDSVYAMVPKYWVRVQGSRIDAFRHDLSAPESFQQAGSSIQTFVTFLVTASSIATFVLLLFVIALFLKKYHEGEVGINTAIKVFVFLFIIIVIEYGLKYQVVGTGTSLGDVNRFNVRMIVFVITVLIVQAFLAAMVFAAWSVGESSARRGWGNKLSAIDGILNKKLFTLDFANSTVMGYSFGFVILGLTYGVAALVSSSNNVSLFTIPLLNGIPESFFPSLSAVLFALRIAILNEIVFRLFFVSWLREKTKKTWPGILISSLLWTLVAFTLWDFPLGYPSFAVLFPAYFLISVCLGLILVKYDLLTAIFTNFVLLAFTYAVPMLTSSGSFYEMQSMLFFVFMAAPLGVAAIGFVKQERFVFSRELIPTHVRRISERERMAQELEIARNVQMSLLPKKNPLLEGYDIAGVCIPALEVGGDYYDFFHLGDGKLGISIGDVSGKGVPAAIYMTLTKGILQSHAGENISPKEVLSKLNKQMYLNIEKNSFVSMFYAVLDMKNRKIRFARAGHNPAILAHREVGANRMLEPKGIAVGLEAGDRFHDFLEEHEVDLQSGDVLTFYTDGFTEASTKDGDEYGEEKLMSVISRNKSTSANVLIQNVVRSVRKFVGNHPQHDDMTMVVLKVL
jgi:sigma-B regulation protein RsbU (phosphoserine phosphatase)